MRDRNMILGDTCPRKLTILDGIRDSSEEVSHELKTEEWRVNYVKSREEHFRYAK